MLPSTDALLDGLLDWVRIETHTPDTAGLNSIMDLVQRQAEAFGATCQRFPGTGGKGDHLLVLSPWGDHEQKGVLLLSHLDTVHPRERSSTTFRSASRQTVASVRASAT